MKENYSEWETRLRQLFQAQYGHLLINMHSQPCPADAVRIDRQTRWGNPYPMKGEDHRVKVIASYYSWLRREVKEGRVSREELATLAGKRLACWCAPRYCHGLILAYAADRCKANNPNEGD